MKFIIDLADKGIYTILIPPYALFWGAMILAFLIIAKWYFNHKREERNSQEWRSFNDNRKSEIVDDSFRKGGENINEGKAYH